MSYQEKEISEDQFGKALHTLDLDEGIRIENKFNMIFINRSAKRYCINTSTQGNDEFFYCNSMQDVLEFLNGKIDPKFKIFSY